LHVTFVPSTASSSSKISSSTTSSSGLHITAHYPLHLHLRTTVSCWPPSTSSETPNFLLSDVQRATTTPTWISRSTRAPAHRVTNFHRNPLTAGHRGVVNFLGRWPDLTRDRSPQRARPSSFNVAATHFSVSRIYHRRRSTNLRFYIIIALRTFPLTLFIFICRDTIEPECIHRPVLTCTRQSPVSESRCRRLAALLCSCSLLLALRTSQIYQVSRSTLPGYRPMHNLEITRRTVTTHACSSSLAFSTGSSSSSKMILRSSFALHLCPTGRVRRIPMSSSEL